MPTPNALPAIDIDCLNHPALQPDGTCPVPDDIDFLYIMRRDTGHVAGTLLKGVPKDTAIKAYNGFTSDLGDVLANAFAGHGRVQLHLYQPEFLEAAQKQRAPDGITMSLDPLIAGAGIVPFGVSRHYYPGGTQEKQVGPRPGFAPLAAQIAALSGRHQITVLEDDVFSGSSIKGLAAQMKLAGTELHKVVPGIQVGDPVALHDSGIICQPIVKYVSGGQRPIDGRIDLGDPRDFLLGADGLVVDYGDGQLGRAPYILPFVSPAARLGIPKSDEKAFSQAILQLNIAFYTALEEQHGQRITLADCDPTFQQTAKQYGVADGPQTSLLDIAKHCLHNLDKMQTHTVHLHTKAKGHSYG